MSTPGTFISETGQRAHLETYDAELEVRGKIPSLLDGSLVVATSRRHKDRSRFSRWHDSPADLMRLDLCPGRPGRVRAKLLSVEPAWQDLARGFSQPVHFWIRASGVCS